MSLVGVRDDPGTLLGEFPMRREGMEMVARIERLPAARLFGEHRASFFLN